MFNNFSNENLEFKLQTLSKLLDIRLGLQIGGENGWNWNFILKTDITQQI